MPYEGLRSRLLSASGIVPMTFEEVEALVGPLPPSARRWRQWWANSRSHSHSRAWLDAGYRVNSADVLGERVVFVPSEQSGAGRVAKVSAVSNVEAGEVAPGSSQEQRRAEEALLEALSEEIGVSLKPRSVRLSSGSWLAVDGVCEDPPVYCEAWAHIGPPKAAQRAKVAKDVLKLSFLASLAVERPRLILLFSDEAACAPFRHGSWVSDVIEAEGIEIKVVQLPKGLHEAVLDAQKRQYR